MNIIPIKCPSCGAKAKADASRKTVVCEYCGTESFVQRRVGVLERPVQVPETANDLPVATEPHSARWLLSLLLVPALCIGVPVTAGVYKMMSTYFIGTSTPVLVDVDGDGDKDVVSVAKRESSDDAWVGAWDGTTGDRLWKSETIGELADAVGGVVAVVDTTVLFVHADASVLALDARTGQTKWKASSLGERVATVCRDEAGFAVVELTDDSFRRLALADGKVTTVASHACSPVPHSKQKAPPDVELVEPVHAFSDGIRIELAFRRGDRWLLTGTKQRGSSVPMLLGAELTAAQLAEHGELPSTWQTPIAAADPLKADADPEDVAVSDDLVFAAYESAEDDAPSRLTAVSIADGTRKWDVALDGDLPLSNVAYADGRVYVAMWASLFVHDAATGEHLYTVGR